MYIRCRIVIMKTGVETLCGICYKLRMMGIPIDGATHIYGDSMSVNNTASKPESILKKKDNAVCYHTVHGSIALGESLTPHIDGDENPTDLLTKVICGRRRRYIVNNILHDVYNSEFKPYAVTFLQVFLNPVLEPKILEGTRSIAAEQLEYC